MSLDRALAIKSILASYLKDVYSSAIHFKMPHEKLLERKQLFVLNDPLYRKAPRWVHAYLNGMEDIMRDNIYRYHLVWLMSVDGKLLTRKEMDELYKQEKAIADKHKPNDDYKSPWARVNSELSNHYWKDDNGNPLRDKPF